MATRDLESAVAQARDLARDVLAPKAAEVDREMRWPEHSIRALQRAGFGGLTVPVDHGGMGMGLTGLARVTEALAEGCPSSALCFGMHCVGAAVLAAKATDDQRRRFLEPIVAGLHLTTLALSEPGTGSHFYLPQTELTKSDGGFVVRGTKSFVTNGGHADSYVISTAPHGGEIGQFSCFILPNDAEGLHWSDDWHGLGMRGNSSRSARLDDVRLPRSMLLGREGDELWYVFNVVAPYFLMAMAGTYLGIAQAALTQGIAHIRKRTYSHSGAALGHQPVIQHRVGELWAAVERTRALIYRAGALADAGHADALPALCSAKAEVAKTAVDTANEVMTLMGGQGYATDSPVHRLLRDARAAHVMSPTTDILRTWTGRALLGVPLLAE